MWVSIGFNFVETWILPLCLEFEEARWNVVVDCLCFGWTGHTTEVLTCVTPVLTSTIEGIIL